MKNSVNPVSDFQSFSFDGGQHFLLNLSNEHSMQNNLWNFQCSMLTQIFGDYCEFKILICLCLNFRDILRVRVFLGQARKAKIGMSIKFQTLANECFEIMMILKNMRIKKSVMV